MYAQDVLGDCPVCGDEIQSFKTRSHKRFAKCVNEACGLAYPLPHKGSIEVTGEVCPLSSYPVIVITPHLRLAHGQFRRQASKAYLWADKPCFTCKNVDTCPLRKDLLEDYE